MATRCKRHSYLIVSHGEATIWERQETRSVGQCDIKSVKVYRLIRYYPVQSINQWFFKLRATSARCVTLPGHLIFNQRHSQLYP